MGLDSSHAWLDGPFLGLQIGACVLWVVLILASGWRPPFLIKGIVPLAFVLSVGASIAWNVGLPPTSGIDGAGRFVYGGGAALANAALASIALFIRLDKPRAIKIPAFLLASTIGYWLFFLFR